MIRKLLFLVLIAVSIAAYGQEFQGLRIGPGTGGTSTGGGSWSLDEDFDAVGVSTSTWGISLEPSRSIGAQVTAPGDGKMYLSGGTYTADFTGALLLPIGIFRTIHGNFTATMKFDYDPTQTSDNFGFILHQPNFRGWMYYSRLHHEQISGVEKLYRREVVNWGGILDTPTPPTVTATQGIYLRVIRQDTALHTQYSTDGSTYATCPANATTWQPHASDPVVLWICTWSEGSHITTGTVDFLHITQP